MEKNVIKNLYISDIGSNACGVAKIDNKVHFVPFCLQGEIVDAIITKQEKNFNICSLKNVITKSFNRETPKCKYFGICGGCRLQHMNKDTQNLYLQNFIQQSLLRQNITCKVSPIVNINWYNYRNKVNFKINGNKLCFSSIDNNNIQIDNCPLFVEDLNTIIEIINKFLCEQNHNFTAFHVRKLNNNYQFTFVASEYFQYNFKTLASALEKHYDSFSIFVSKNTIKNSSNITQNIKCYYGSEYSIYTNNQITSHISPPSFLQVNEQVQDLIYDKINSLIKQDDVVINAYGGTGILSAIIAKKAKKVYSVEIDKSSSINCEQMLLLNNIKNVVSICDDCKNAIPNLLKKDKSISYIVFDPPRQGIDKSILDVVLNSQIDRIIYLSCNPNTLAKDLKVLQQKYNIELIQPYNMFPQTDNIETLVILNLKQ